MADLAQAASDASESYGFLMEDVLAFLEEEVLSEDEVTDLEREQSAWEAATEASAVQARDGQGHRSGYAMAIDYFGVYFDAYPERIGELIDLIPVEPSDGGDGSRFDDAGDDAVEDTLDQALPDGVSPAA